jgi:hypothetical protein
VYGQRTTDGVGWYVEGEITKLPTGLAPTVVHSQRTTSGVGSYGGMEITKLPNRDGSYGGREITKLPIGFSVVLA